MKIAFLLPNAGTIPVGGFKVAYEYANGLARKGHTVYVLHPAAVPSKKVTPLGFLTRDILTYTKHALFGSWRPSSWFRMDPRVKMLWAPVLAPQFLPNVDAIVATAWMTAERLAQWPQQKGRKYYLIQHLETWDGAQDRVMATWRAPLEKIVIARWLARIGEELGEHTHYIPNGIDFDRLGCDTPPESRNAASVSMLYHTADWKGSQEGLAALKIVKANIPDLRAEFFGVAPAPSGLPDWIQYHHNPPQNELRALYNRSAIFVAPSRIEGWGLPPAEAVACGCALAITDTGGHREYAHHNQTALLSPPQQPEALARNIEKLIREDDLRRRIAHAGENHIKQFTWERAVQRLQKILQGLETL